MAIHKNEAFGKKKQRVATYARAFSHPARIAILKILAKKGSCNCNELVKQMPLSQSTVSQHLKELKSCGLINSIASGTSSMYSLNKIAMRGFEKDFKRLLKSLKSKK